MTAVLEDHPDALSRIVTKIIERSPLYSARDALETAVAECERRGIPADLPAIQRARAAAKRAVADRTERREEAERAEEAQLRADRLARQAARAEAPVEQPAEPWKPLDINDPRAWANGRLPGLLASFRFDPDAEDRPPSWRVKGLLPETGLGLLYGESQAGKSFLAVWIALSVAYGLPLFGRRSKPGGVLYIAAEGGKSVARRFRVANAKLRDALPAANMARKGLPPLTRSPVEIVYEAPNLSRDGKPDALAATIRQIDHDYRAEGSCLALVVLDTYHASLGGADENSAADAGHALRPLKEAVEATGAFVLIVHHPGKDAEKGARGSNALAAAVDTSIELRVPTCAGAKAKPSTALRHATIIKQRDGETGGEFHFRLPVVEIGRDEDGDPVTTCVVEPADAPATDEAGRPMGKGDMRLTKALDAAVAECGRDRVELRVVRGFFNNACDPDQSEEAKRKAWTRAVEKARAAGLVETDTCDQFIWRPTTGDGQ